MNNDPRQQASQSDDYNAEADADAWQRTLKFFKTVTDDKRRVTG